MEHDFLELKLWLDETRDLPLETMSGFFDSRIDSYEDHMARWKKHYQWMAELIPPDTKKLLDLGCGTGLELDCIYSRFPDLQVTGVDLSAQMLKKLQQKHGDKGIQLILQDYFLFEPEEDCFDVVITFQTLHHFTAEKKRSVFRKIYNALKPGGLYLECDYIASSQEIEELTYAESLRRRARDGISKDTFVHFDTPRTLEHELTAIGSVGFQAAECLGFLAEDNHTAMIRAKKEPCSIQRKQDLLSDSAHRL